VSEQAFFPSEPAKPSEAAKPQEVCLPAENPAVQGGPSGSDSAPGNDLSVGGWKGASAEGSGTWTGPVSLSPLGENPPEKAPEEKPEDFTAAGGDQQTSHFLAPSETRPVEKETPTEYGSSVSGVQAMELSLPERAVAAISGGPLPGENVQGVQSASANGPMPSGAPEKSPEKPPKSDKMEWYILKVQTNREESIREGLLRRAAIAGLDHYFGEIIIPTEKVTEFKGGKKRITSRKLYPGYLVVQMELNDDTWFLVRETPGIGDFTGAIGRPSPLPPHEVNRILAKKEERPGELPKLKIGFQLGDRVKITEGTFENFEGEVSSIDETNGRVTVMISIFNRTTPVEFEYWQLEKV